MAEQQQYQLKGMEICSLPDGEFTIAALRNVNEWQENRKAIQQDQENNTWVKWEVQPRNRIHKKSKQILHWKYNDWTEDLNGKFQKF